MGLLPGSVYAAFGSKRDLFAAAVRRYIDTVLAEAIDPELSAMFQLHLARLQTSFAAALARARADGELRPGAGPGSASMLVAGGHRPRHFPSGRHGRPLCGPTS